MNEDEMLEFNYKNPTKKSKWDARNPCGEATELTGDITGTWLPHFGKDSDPRLFGHPSNTYIGKGKKIPVKPRKNPIPDKDDSNERR